MTSNPLVSLYKYSRNFDRSREPRRKKNKMKGRDKGDLGKGDRWISDFPTATG